MAKICLEANKNVLVEKPITLELPEAEQLVSVAETRKLKLMVGHVLLYHPAVKKIKEGISNGHIGKLQYIYSNRLNLGSIRSEENILWGFAPHDISIIQYLTESFPEVIQAHGAGFVQNGIEDATLTYMSYLSGVKAHIFVSWLHPFKEQRLVVIGAEGMYVFEDTLKTEKLKYYKKGFHNLNGRIEKFDQDYDVIEIEDTIPLSAEHLHFYDSIINDTIPLTDGKHALEVLQILVEATDSMNGVVRRI